MVSPQLVDVQRWVLRVGLFLLPLAYTWNTYDRWVLPKLLLARLLVVLLLGIMAVRAVAEGRLVLKRTPLDLAWLAFLGSAALSTVFATNPNVAIFGIYTRYDGLLTLLSYSALFWLAVQTLEGPEDARSLLRTLLASAYVAAGLAILQSVSDTVQPGATARAYGTFGQWNVLGAFLAMCLPTAVWELGDARTGAARLVAANVCVVLTVALLLTFSRSSWLGAALGSAILLWKTGWWRPRMALLAAAGAATAIAFLALAGGGQLEMSLLARAQSVTNPQEWAPRFWIWRDSLNLIAGSPIVGYGPDSFGLVFARFDSTYFHEPIDKAHAETLQIAATQGLVGVGAYLLMLFSFARAFWRGRSAPGALAVFGGWLAYEVSLQVNFTALGSALPFWIFAAAAMHRWRVVTDGPELRVTKAAALGLRTALAGLALTAAVGVVLPYLADVSLLSAVQADRAGDGALAQAASTQAHRASPQESVYAVEVANVAFERGDWATARLDYLEAARLGTYNPMVYRNLAFADGHLGFTSEATAAAYAAYELNRFDPANQAVLAQFGGSRA